MRLRARSMDSMTWSSRSGSTMNSWNPFIATVARSSLVSRSKYCISPSAPDSNSRPFRRKGSSATAALLFTAGKVENLEDGAQAARDALLSGRAGAVLHAYAEASRG